MTVQDPFARPHWNQRRLAAIDRRLTADAPHLGSMFTVFNRLSDGEQVGGMEQLPAPPPRRYRPSPAQLAVLLALAVVAALCFVLTTQVQSAVGACRAPVSVALASQAAVGGASCSAYATGR